MAEKRKSKDSVRKGPEGRRPGTASPRTAALTLLGRRDYTTAELREKLLDRGYPETDVNSTLFDLAEGGLVDDRRVAANHVRAAAGLKGRGRYRIARELAARGIPREVADRALEAVEPDDEAAAIQRILARKKWPPKPTIDERRRMFQHLLRRGFPADAIRRALGGRVDVDSDE